VNKLIPLIAFSVLLLVPAVAQDAFAATFTFSDDATGGDCTSLGSWDDPTNTCTVTAIAASTGDIFVIDSGVTLVVAGGPGNNEGKISCATCSFTITNNGKLIVNGGGGSISGQILTTSGTTTINNNGIIQINGGSGVISGVIISTAGTIIINNNGLIETNGASTTRSGAILTTSGIITITNEACGTVELNGGGGIESGSITDDGGTITFTNHGTLTQIPGSGANSGILKNTATLIEDPQSCQAIGVGGEYFTLDSTALLLAGVQTNLAWIIPVLSAAGIGAFILRKKF